MRPIRSARQIHMVAVFQLLTKNRPRNILNYEAPNDLLELLRAS